MRRGVTDLAQVDIRDLPIVRELPYGLKLGGFFEARLCYDDYSIVLYDPVHELHISVPLPINPDVFAEAKAMLMAARAWKIGGGRMLTPDDMPTMPIGVNE